MWKHGSVKGAFSHSITLPFRHCTILFKFVPSNVCCFWQKWLLNFQLCNLKKKHFGTTVHIIKRKGDKKGGEIKRIMLFASICVSLVGCSGSSKLRRPSNIDKGHFVQDGSTYFKFAQLGFFCHVIKNNASCNWCFHLHSDFQLTLPRWSRAFFHLPQTRKSIVNITAFGCSAICINKQVISKKPFFGPLRKYLSQCYHIHQCTNPDIFSDIGYSICTCVIQYSLT